eukprot:scaffold80120_cov37-Tisochrysis_lutea.AAC.2
MGSVPPLCRTTDGRDVERMHSGVAVSLPWGTPPARRTCLVRITSNGVVSAAASPPAAAPASASSAIETESVVAPESSRRERSRADGPKVRTMGGEVIRCCQCRRDHPGAVRSPFGGDGRAPIASLRASNVGNWMSANGKSRASVAGRPRYSCRKAPRTPRVLKSVDKET